MSNTTNSDKTLNKKFKYLSFEMLLCFRAKGTRQFKRKVNQKNL